MELLLCKIILFIIYFLFYIYCIKIIPSKTKKNKKIRNKTSKRVLEMQKDPATVWGKNKPLEKFWRSLASGKMIVVVYKNGKHKYVNLPNPTTQKSKTLFNDFEINNDITAVLSSNLSQDSYEIYLYPKAKHNSVEYVIKNYKKFFTSMGELSKGVMTKVLVPS